MCVSSSSKSFPSASAIQEHGRAGPSWEYRQQALREEPSSLITWNVCILAACWVSLFHSTLISLGTDRRFWTFRLHREWEVGYPRSFAHKHPGLRISLARQVSTALCPQGSAVGNNFTLEELSRLPHPVPIICFPSLKPPCMSEIMI